jgi:hypothetical protein
MLQRLRKHQPTPMHAPRCQAPGTTGWTDIGTCLVDGTRGSAATGCVRHTQAGIGSLHGAPAGVSSRASGEEAIGTWTADLPITTAGFRAVIRLSGRATCLPHRVDLDSGMATIAETGRETEKVEAAADESSRGSLVWFPTHERPVTAARFSSAGRRMLGPCGGCRAMAPPLSRAGHARLVRIRQTLEESLSLLTSGAGRSTGSRALPRRPLFSLQGLRRARWALSTEGAAPPLPGRH